MRHIKPEDKRSCSKKLPRNCQEVKRSTARRPVTARSTPAASQAHGTEKHHYCAPRGDLDECRLNMGSKCAAFYSLTWKKAMADK